MKGELMEDLRTYRFEDEKPDRDEENREELESAAARAEEEVPFHIPRD
ncbi:MAG TPA: hypothetical protein VM779_10635 [Thermoanaerobaculia bacterium]|nr:hypothetical protein [Thermoanaerobaculia bacterium]